MGVPFDGLYVARDRAAFDIENLDAFFTDLGNIAVFHKDHAPRVRQERRHVGGQKVFFFAQTNDERRVFAGGDQAIRIVRRDNTERIGALHLLQGCDHSLRQIAFEIFFDQMGEDFGVGLRLKLVAPGDQLLLEIDVILDDSVMNHDISAFAAGMRVSVFFGRTAVRRPARMPQADRAIERLARELLFQISELALGAPACYRRRARGWPRRRNHSRGSRRLSASINSGATGSRPMIPIMPHMLADRLRGFRGA